MIIAGITIVTIVVFWICALFWLLDSWLTGYGWYWGVACLVLFVVPVGAFIGMLAKHDQEHPCVQYETRLQYNAATKTMMPMRVCVLRGEWIEMEATQ